MSGQRLELQSIDEHGFGASPADLGSTSTSSFLGRLLKRPPPAMGPLMVSLRTSAGLALLAGTAVFVLLPAAHAGRPEHQSRAPSSGGGGAANAEVQRLLHDQKLAVERNTRYFAERDRFSRMLLRLHEKTLENPRQAEQLKGAIAADRQGLAAVERTILVSRWHLMTTLAPKVRRVHYLLNRMGKVGPQDRGLSAFVAFALKRQQSVLDQLMKILNEEHASTVLPGL
jgi:hypothetical protein